jgi:hypothetical protein
VDTSIVVGAANYDTCCRSYKKMRGDRDGKTNETSAEVCAINQ